jgi:hypothetical protein
MNELDKKEVPEVSGGYMQRPGNIPCTSPPTFPGPFPSAPEVRAPITGPGYPVEDQVA